jgi:AcrR family transcriptional regulator
MVRERHRTGSDTRARIQEVAVELFAEQGYDKTSLREIADQLGVTKAALYYHFKSKEEIVVATVQDFLTDIDDLIEWGKAQPRDETMKREVLRRYSVIVARRFPSMRFFQQNPAAMHKTEMGERFKERMGGMHRLLYDEGGAPAERIRALLALVGMHMVGGGIFEDDTTSTEDDRMQAAVDVAYELVSKGPIEPLPG